MPSGVWEDVTKLDKYEDREIIDNKEVGMYRRQYIPIKLSKQWKTVITFIVNKSIEYRLNSYHKPSKEYMKTIISGAKYHNLDEDYIDLLENIECEC